MPKGYPPEEIRRQNHTIRSTALVPELVEAHPNLLFLLNRQRQIVGANHVALETLHLRTEEEILGFRPGEIFHCQHAGEAPSGCGTAVACRSCGLVASLLLALDGYHDDREAEFVSAEKERHVFHVSTRPVATHKEIVLLALIDMGQMRQQDLFEQVFFHDILNTVGGMAGLIRLLAQTSTSPDMVALLEQQAELLVEEIENQKVYRQAASDRLQMNWQPVPLPDTLHYLASLYRCHPCGQERRIEVVDRTGGVLLVTDRHLLLRVLGNLLKNALEASAPGEQVTLTSEKMEAKIVLRVGNRQAIPTHFRENLFCPTQSSKGAHRGFGLYCVKMFTERYLEGRVEWSSDESLGTEFSIHLPPCPSGARDSEYAMC